MKTAIRIAFSLVFVLIALNACVVKLMGWRQTTLSPCPERVVPE